MTADGGDKTANNMDKHIEYYQSVYLKHDGTPNRHCANNRVF